MPSAPAVFRVILQVSNLDQGIVFYAGLLGVPGRKVGGSRAYFDCGSVILALLYPTPGGGHAVSNANDLYFAVSDLEAVHARARVLGCLSRQDVHGDSGGDIVVRPWGELSFYAEDPWGNGLCFVDEATIFSGRSGI